MASSGEMESGMGPVPHNPNPHERQEKGGLPKQENEGLPEMTRAHAREAFDAGIYAALELCRQSLDSDEPFHPFEAFEKRAILLALRATNGNQLRAARLLGINRATLRKRMQKHHISVGTKIIERRP